MKTTALLEILMVVFTLGLCGCAGLMGYYIYSKRPDSYENTQRLGNICLALIFALVGCILLHWRRS